MNDFESLFGAPISGVFWTDYEHSVMQRALKLAEGQSPYSNMVPYMDLIRAADRLKLDVVRRP